MPQLSGLGSDNREQAYKRIPSGTAKYGIKICFLLICFKEWNFSSYLVRGRHRPSILMKQRKGDQACALYAKSIRHTCYVYLAAQFQTCPVSIFQSPLHLNFCNYCWNIYYCRCLFLLIVTLFHALIRELISFLFLNFTSFMFVMFVLTHVIF